MDCSKEPPFFLSFLNNSLAFSNVSVSMSRSFLSATGFPIEPDSRFDTKRVLEGETGIFDTSLSPREGNMAESSKSSKKGKSESRSNPYADYQERIQTAKRTGTTGRFLIVFEPGAKAKASKALTDKAGFSMVSTADSKEGFIPSSELENKDLMCERLGIAIVEPEDDKQQSLVASIASAIGVRQMIPERVRRVASIPTPVPPTVFPNNTPAYSPEYMRGYMDAVTRLLMGMPGMNLPTSSLIGGIMPPFQMPYSVGVPMPVPQVSSATTSWNQSEYTWGLQAVEIPNCKFTGKGIKIAILDSGLDLNHPDFQDGRVQDSKSFIPGESEALDRLGHGTHVAGTAVGSKDPTGVPRYGIASDAEIYIAKVADDRGDAPDGEIIQGIEWALATGCQIGSISIEGPDSLSSGFPGESRSDLYRDIGRKCLLSGLILVAAAGNRSKRPWVLTPCGYPAGSETVLGIGAIDENYQIASFSNTSGAAPGTEINVVGPGVDVFSAASSLAISQQYMPTERGFYRYLSGTSQATPHVSGVLAALAEKFWRSSVDAATNAAYLMDTMLSLAKRVNSAWSKADAGYGIVQAWTDA
jgi:subtilisin